MAAGGPGGRRGERAARRARAREKMGRAKGAARAELGAGGADAGWRRYGYALDPGLLSAEGLGDAVPRVDAAGLSREEFWRRYEIPRRPVVLTGLGRGWPAHRRWTLSKLAKRAGSLKFKIGTDDDGYAVRLKFKYFAEYVKDKHQAALDDSPVYVFDPLDRPWLQHLLGDYTVPELFGEDLFQHAGARRPPYRWMVFGPARSGTGIHIDPLGTSAWNALLSGLKRWVLFPPSVPLSALQARPPGVDREGVSWFKHVYPRTRRDDWPHAPPIDLLQRPGETVFVPAGWSHAVLNLELSVAVTHNFCSSVNFGRVWRHARKSRPKMAAKWHAALRRVRPDLCAQADEMSSGDGSEDISSCSSTSTSSSSSSAAAAAAAAATAAGGRDKPPPTGDEAQSKRCKVGEGGGSSGAAGPSIPGSPLKMITQSAGGAPQAEVHILHRKT